MWVIITRNQCSFCDAAKALMKGADSSKWILSLLKRSSITTVPQIFKPDGTHLGGYTELKEYIHETYS